MVHEQKLIRPVELHNDYVHHVCYQSPQRFVRKCTETTNIWRAYERILQQTNESVTFVPNH